MSKVFNIEFGSPEDSVNLYFHGNDNKTKEDFMEAMRICIVEALNRHATNWLQGYDSLFAESEYCKKSNTETFIFEKNMEKMGFSPLIPDIKISDCCWDRIGKSKGKYRIEPFYDHVGDFGQYLLSKGFEIKIKKTSSS